MEHFFINCIEILPEVDRIGDRSLYKNLKVGKYLLNDYYVLDENNNLKINEKNHESTYFYGDGINIQVIVGRNGCGKSTLMDMLYVAANNLAYLISQNEERMTNKAKYVADVYLRIYYTQNSKDYVVTCFNDRIFLSDVSGKSVIDKICIEETRTDDSFCYNPSNQELIRKGYKGKGLDYKGQSEVLRKFFYTIVTNYSVQSLVDQNYISAYYGECESDGNIKKIDKRRNLITRQSWITALFHKNDGYVKPIVLNPFRDEGRIKWDIEMGLSKERLASLLIFYSKRDTDVLSPYILKKIELNFCKDYDSFLREGAFLEKIRLDFYKIMKSDEFTLTLEQIDYFYGKLPEIVVEGSNHFVSEKNVFLQAILKKFKLPYIQNNEIAYSAYAYLQSKIFKIIFNYSAFEKYEKVVVYNYSKNNFDIDIDGLEQLLNDIINDKSHITRKIRRTVNFLALENDAFKKNYELDKESFFERFSFSDKSIFLSDKSEDNLDIDDINDCLAPPFFDYNLIMDKKGERGNIIEENIDYRGLSSGETQMLQTLSVHAYHITNLLSVPSDRIKYDNINLVFDEVEICFHPEFQRQFVHRLVTMLKELKSGYEKRRSSMHENSDCFFNVLILTHSPFVLSDIQPGRTLFLKETGEPDYDLSKKSTFAGNIGEMFYEAFFLKSTIGVFAEEKIKRLAKIRQGKNPDNGDDVIDETLKTKLDDEAEQIFSAISDPIVKCIMEK